MFAVVKEISSPTFRSQFALLFTPTLKTSPKYVVLSSVIVLISTYIGILLRQTTTDIPCVIEGFLLEPEVTILSSPLHISNVIFFIFFSPLTLKYEVFMAVRISTSKEDELNSVILKTGHPLNSLNQKGSDDVVYLHIPVEMLEEVI